AQKHPAVRSRAKNDAVEGQKTYAYEPHLDPTLVWAGKTERTSFEIPTVSLHVHERIDPRSIIEAIRKKNGSDYEQLSLFSSKAENPPLREAIEFYKQAHNWSNRLVAGDSLLVMNSLLEMEGINQPSETKRLADATAALAATIAEMIDKRLRA